MGHDMVQSRYKEQAVILAIYMLTITVHDFNFLRHSIVEVTQN